MPIIPPGYCEVTWHTAIAEGYRPQSTACGFAIAGFDTVNGPNILNGYWETFLEAIGYAGGSPAGPTVIRVGTSDPTAPLTYVSGVTTVSGSQTGNAPPNVSMLATKRTALGGRKGRGRMYLPGPIEANMDRAGVIDTTYWGGVFTALETWIGDTETTLGGGAYLLHSDTTPPTAVTSWELQQIVATQRRRLTR